MPNPDDELMDVRLRFLDRKPEVISGVSEIVVGGLRITYDEATGGVFLQGSRTLVLRPGNEIRVANVKET